MESNQEREEREYKPAEVADILGITTDLLRKWTDNFNIQVEKTDKGHRRYNKENVEQLIRISKLIKEQNWSWDQVRAWQNGEANEFRTYEQQSLLDKKLDEILEVLKEEREARLKQEQFNMALVQQLASSELKYRQLEETVQLSLPEPGLEDHEKEELRLENERMKEKLDKAVDFILKMEKKEEEANGAGAEKKKGIWSRLFG